MTSRDNFKKYLLAILTNFLLFCFFQQFFSIITINNHPQGVMLPLIAEAAANIETLRPGGFSDSTGKTANPTWAYDNDPSLLSSADIPTGVTASPSISYYSWGHPTSKYLSLTLYVSRSSAHNLDDKWGIKYSINGGQTWSNLDPMTSQNISKSEVSVSLDPSQDLSSLQVRIDTSRVKTNDNGHVSIYDIRTVGDIYVAPPLYQSSYRFFKNVDSVDLSAIVSNRGGAGEANAIAVDPSYMYVAGFEPGKWRIEKRNLEDGKLVASVDSDSGGGAANAIAIDPRYMYVAGDDYSGGNYRWRIEKRSLSDLSLAWAIISDPSKYNDSANAIAIDQTYMYVVGSDGTYGSSDAQWRIEKRKLSDGSLVAAVVENPSNNDDEPLALAIDTSHMYVVGYDRIPGSSKGSKGSSFAEWRIEKRLLSDLSLEKFANSNTGSDNAYARGVSVDSGAIYVIGSEELAFFDTQWRIEKRSLNDLGVDFLFGEDCSAYDDQSTAIAIDSDSMYVAGYSSTIISGSSGDAEWRIEKRRLDNGIEVSGFGQDGFVTNNIYPNNDRAYAIAIDVPYLNNPKRYMYVAGYDNPGLPEWRIEKRDLADGSLGFLAPLGNQDEMPPIPIPPCSEFRLRILIQVQSGTLLENGQQFKLQFCKGQVCIDQASWDDVRSDSDIAFFDNPTPSNGDVILGNKEDPSDGCSTRYQTYVEAYVQGIGFTNSVSNIAAREDGMWDFSLIAGNQATGPYYFRIVRIDGSGLDSYAPYPQITIGP